MQSSTLSDKRLFERKAMKLFSNAVSPCCQKVKMCLYELNLTFCETEVSLQSKENLSAWYTKLNPNGTIPALQVGDKVIGDSTKICLYLDKNFGNTIQEINDDKFSGLLIQDDKDQLKPVTYIAERGEFKNNRMLQHYQM